MDKPLNLPPAIIIDLDGTLINSERRCNRLGIKDMNAKRGPDYDWSKFFENMEWDTTYPWCLEIVMRFHRFFHILFVTRRNEGLRAATIASLEANNVPRFFEQYQLFMAHEDDRRDSAESKKDIYYDHIMGKYNVLFAIDDDPEVLDMWVELKIPGLLVRQGAVLTVG